MEELHLLRQLSEYYSPASRHIREMNISRISTYVPATLGDHETCRFCPHMGWLKLAGPFCQMCTMAFSKLSPIDQDEF
jgi:hypothetical protein